MADNRSSVTFSKITMRGKSAIRWVVVVIIVIGLGAWWAFRPRSVAVVQPAGANDVGAPSRCYATLTLADGGQMALHDAASGVLATQGGARIVKRTDGRVIYRADAQDSGELLYNTLDNPR